MNYTTMCRSRARWWFIHQNVRKSAPNFWVVVVKISLDPGCGPRRRVSSIYTWGSKTNVLLRCLFAIERSMIATSISFWLRLWVLLVKRSRFRGLSISHHERQERTAIDCLFSCNDTSFSPRRRFHPNFDTITKEYSDKRDSRVTCECDAGYIAPISEENIPVPTRPFPLPERIRPYRAKFWENCTCWVHGENFVSCSIRSKWEG